jgi:2-polyprenyl-3-methyl-5-hydroxy-6-metoxy-1,4-benzoquinol methylase
MKAPIYDGSWPDDVLALYRHDMQEIWDPTIAPQIWNQYHNQLDLYLSLAGDGAPLEILDVGCAQGTLALKLAEGGHRVCAVDLRQQFLDYARSRYEFGDIEFHQGNVLELELERSFDLIFANQIVEHLVYPLEMVYGLKKLLKDDGRLIVTTPNGDYLVDTLPSYAELGEPEQWKHMQFTADADGHFYSYLGSELGAIFAQAGFAHVEVQYFETPWISGHMKVRYLHEILPLSALRWLDRLMLKLPLLKRRFAHQLMVVGSA